MHTSNLDDMASVDSARKAPGEFDCLRIKMLSVLESGTRGSRKRMGRRAAREAALCAAREAALCVAWEAALCVAREVALCAAREAALCVAREAALCAAREAALRAVRSRLAHQVESTPCVSHTPLLFSDLELR